jgi:hypothetical protein
MNAAPASSFLEDLKSYAQQAVLVRRAVAASPADRALAEALREHIARFRTRPDASAHAMPAPRGHGSKNSKLP